MNISLQLENLNKKVVGMLQLNHSNEKFDSFEMKLIHRNESNL